MQRDGQQSDSAGRAVYHQGNGSHILMNSIDDDTIMITVFSSHTTVGLVRFYSTGISANLATYLHALRSQGSGEMRFSDVEIGTTRLAER